MNNILRETIESTNKACTKTLNDTIRHIGDDVGWHQHLGTDKIGVVATAIALLYFKMIENECPEKDKCISFLVSKQNDDGGWPYISNSNGKSNVEATCWALQALFDYESDKYKAIIDKGVNYLLFAQHASIGNSDTGWSFAGEAFPKTYLTAFVLRTLSKIKYNNTQEFESAKRWLLNAQNDDGGWGELSDKSSSLFFTSYVIIALLESGCSITDIEIRDASKWLINRLNEVSITDPSCLCYMEFFEMGSGEERKRITSFHYVLPYVAQAIMILGVGKNKLLGILNLINKRAKEGFVEHPMLENSKTKPIWAIYDTVSSNVMFMKQAKDWATKYEFISIRNHIFSFCKFNPLRFVFRYRLFIILFIFLGLICFLCLKYIPWNYLLKWWNGIQNKTLGQFIISAGGSLFVLLMSKLYSYLKNKIN